MTTPAQFEPAFIETTATIAHINSPDVAFYRFLYDSVGKDWRWRDRLNWHDEKLHAVLAAPTTSLYVLYEGGLPGGYIELDRQNEDGDGGGDTEIAYFGLRPAFTGRGLGKHLLSFGVRQAWDDGAGRVWLHTCNLDSPHALANYKKRGFSVYDVVREPMPVWFL